MVKTPFHDLGSVEILSAHISGLQHAVNKLEEILDLETETVSGLVLTPVADQDDPSLHYRIYEGSVRNWLEDPAPVVYRDGDVVPQDEYDIYPAYGAVIFHEPQGAEAVITADVTYVKAASARLGQYDEALSWIEPALDWLLGHLILHRPGLWRANNVTSSDLAPSATLANVLDVVPFLVLTQTRFDRIAINVSTADAAGTQARLGIYRDNGSLYPGQLVLDAGTVATDGTGVRQLTIDVTLERGLYWLARVQNGTPQLLGYPGSAILSFGLDDTLTGAPCTGWRASYTFGPLPATFPAGGIPLFGGRPSVFLRRAAS